MNVHSKKIAKRVLQSRISIAAWFHVALGLITLGSVQAKDFTLADWAIPLQNQLPPVPKEIISEVDDLWPILENAGYDYEGGIPNNRAYFDAARRMVELRDQGEKALLWQYIKAPEPDEKPAVTARRRIQILKALEYNFDVVQWLLPLARVRMESLIKKIETKREAFSPDMNEIGEIKSYYYCQGEIKDIQTVDDFSSAAADRGYFGEKLRPESIEQQMPQIERIKKSTKNAAHAHWQWLALSLIGKGQLDKSVLANDPNYAGKLEKIEALKKKSENIPQVSPATQPNAQKPATSDAAPEPESQGRFVWPLVVVAATLAAVWVFLLRSK